MSDTNYLHELDNVTAEIIKAVRDLQAELPFGGLLAVPHTKKKVCHSILKAYVRSGEQHPTRSNGRAAADEADVLVLQSAADYHGLIRARGLRLRRPEA